MKDQIKMKEIYNLPEELVDIIFSYYNPYNLIIKRIKLQMKHSCFSYCLKKSLDHHELSFCDYMFNTSKNCKRYIYNSNINKK